MVQTYQEIVGAIIGSITTLVLFALGYYINSKLQQKQMKRNLFYDLLRYRFTTDGNTSNSITYNAIKLTQLTSYINEIPKIFNVNELLTTHTNAFNRAVSTIGVNSQTISPIYDLLLLYLAKQAKLPFNNEADLNNILIYRPTQVNEYESNIEQSYNVAREMLSCIKFNTNTTNLNNDDLMFLNDITSDKKKIKNLKLLYIDTYMK